MRILTEKINLDLNQNGIQATIDLREGDIESRLIIATLRGYGDAFRPDDNVIAVIRAKKPDGTIIYNNCLVEDGKVKFLVSSQYAAVVGNYNACIELIKDGVVLYSPKFSFHVAANELSDSEVESSSEYTELTAALEQALTALELAQNLHLLKFVENLEDEGDEKYLYVLTSDYHYIPYVWDAENERYMELESNLEELAEFGYLLNIQKERVDNLLAEAVPGSTTRDLEVIDGRTGYDGRTYANLGTAIREQINDLHSENTNLQNSMEAADNNLDNIKANKTDVNTTTANIEAEIAVERARIDNIASLAEGSTTGDAELMDIRVGANGITYANAGDAVRGQITNLDNDLLGISLISITETPGYFNTDGSVVAPSDTSLEKYTNRIPIEAGKKIKITVQTEVTTKQWASYCVWRKNGSCIGRTVIENASDNKSGYSVLVTAPSDAYEIAFSYRTYGTHTTKIAYESSIYEMAYQTNRKLDDVDFAEELHDSFSIGTLHNVTGQNYDNDIWVRNDSYIYMPKGAKVIFNPIANNTTYDFYIFPFDKNFNFISSGKTGTWIQGYSREYLVPTGAEYIRVTIRYDNNAQMTPADLTKFSNAVTFKLVTGEQRLATMVQESKNLAGYKFLPNYWDTYLNSKKDSIVGAISNVGNHGDYFAFFTDYHVTTNAKHTPAICKWINENSNLKKVFCGGDILKTHTHDDALELLKEYQNDFNKLDLFTVYGNHDRNIYADGSGYDHEIYYSLEFDEVYNSLFKKNELVADLSMIKYGYYSLTNKTQKIEYIILNTGDNQSDLVNDSNQYNWWFNKLNNIEDGWYVVVFAHMLYEISGGVPQNASSIEFIKKVLDTYQNKTSGTHNETIHFDFTNAHGNVACLIGGHIHIDYSVDSDAGYPIILTTCDSRGEDTTLTRTLGTVLEQAVDLFFIDTAAKTINTIRLGAGSDRSFTFD